MSVFAALLVMVQAFAPTPPPEPNALTPPVDWSIVPSLPWRIAPQPSPELDAFVQRSVAADHCPVVGTRLAVDVAIFLRGDGLPRAVVPRAIDCPSVEQFAAGLVSSLARNNVRLPASGWYRATIIFDWTR